MGSEFLTFLQLGVHHIADLKGYDHILFLAALTVSYRPEDWKRLLWLVTAFTIGHSVTLALATLDIVRVSSRLVEPAIAATIVATSVAAIWFAIRAGRSSGSFSATGQSVRYGMATGFGLIHGLGFSNFLRSLLGEDGSLALPLFSFNVGLEVGQLLIVVAILALGAAAERGLAVSRRTWVLGVSILIAVVGTAMIVQRLG